MLIPLTPLESSAQNFRILLKAIRNVPRTVKELRIKSDNEEILRVVLAKAAAQIRKK